MIGQFFVAKRQNSLQHACSVRKHTIRTVTSAKSVMKMNSAVAVERIAHS